MQQAVGAMKYYDCNKTMVITTSSIFTKEAVALAQANATELVSKAYRSFSLRILGRSGDRTFGHVSKTAVRDTVSGSLSPAQRPDLRNSYRLLA